MPSANPLRAPLPPPPDRAFDQWLYSADEDGRPLLNARLRIVVGPTHLHLCPDVGIGSSASIPLSWLTRVEAIGRGIRIEWTNAPAKRQEELFIGVRGWVVHKPGLRDDLVELLNTRRRAVAAWRPPAARCEVCGDAEYTHYDFTRFTGVLGMGTRAPETRFLCRRHGRGAVRATVLRNAFLGTIGPYGLQAVRHANEVVALARARKVIGAGEASRLRFAAITIPLAMVAAFVVLLRSCAS